MAQHCPSLQGVAGEVGDNQVRHRGTLGGSVAHGDPASDLPAVLLALDATLVARGPGGERTIPVGEFFQGFLETSLAPDELLSEIRVPKATGGWNYQKFNRRAQDWAIVGAVAVNNGSTRISLVNMGGTPLHARAVEQALGRGASIEDAAQHAADGTEPPSSDLNASPEYREHLARVRRCGGPSKPRRRSACGLTHSEPVSARRSAGRKRPTCKSGSIVRASTS